MNKKIIMYTCAFILLYMFETAIALNYKGMKPEYILIGVVAVSLFEYEKSGAVFGLIFGLFCDFSNGGVFGLRAVIFMAFGYLIGFLAANYITPGFFSMSFLCMSFLFVYEFFLFIVHTLSNNTSFIDAFVLVIAPKLLLTLPVIIIVYPIFKKIDSIKIY